MNDVYVIELSQPIDHGWFEAADKSRVLPRAVEALFDGSLREVVRGPELDAIIDWDHSIARQTGTVTQIQCYPLGLGRNGS